MKMNYYLAPMEGVTGYIYRNAHHTHFPHTDKYFTPFLSPTQNHKFSSKELKDVLPENNQGISLIPQLLTHNEEDFIWAAGELWQLGYREVNFNLGCPSPTVVTKRKGSGFLAFSDELNRFLDQVFSKVSMEISIKTRIGICDPREWEELIKIYNRYPLKELIIHPRLQTDYYKNEPNLLVFKAGMEESRCPVIYNGDLFDAVRYDAFRKAFPQVDTVMLGRGAIANPGLMEGLAGFTGLTKQALKAFHDQVYHGYQAAMSGDRNTLFKMKELWFYMGNLFPDNVKYIKQIKKAEKGRDYETAVADLFRDCELKPERGYAIV